MEPKLRTRAKRSFKKTTSKEEKQSPSETNDSKEYTINESVDYDRLSPEESWGEHEEDYLIELKSEGLTSSEIEKSFTNLGDLVSDKIPEKKAS